MKKFKYVFALIALLTVSIYCSKSNDARPLTKKSTVVNATGDSIPVCGVCPDAGTFTPTITVIGIGGASALSAHYTKVANEVTVDGRISWQNATADNTTAFVTLSVPVPYDYPTGNLEGLFNLTQTQQLPTPVVRVPYNMVGTSSGGTGAALLQFTVPSATKTGVVAYHYAYTATIIQ